MVKTRYFEASDGSIQPLPDNINQLFDTDFNEFERLEKEYIAAYNQPKPEASPKETDFIDDEDIENKKLNSLNPFDPYGMLGEDLPEPPKEQSTIGEQVRAGFSKLNIELPALKEIQRIAPDLVEAKKEINELGNKKNLTTEDKDRIEFLRKRLEGEDKTPEEILQDVTRETRFSTRDPSYNFIRKQVEDRQGLEKTLQDNIDLVERSRNFQNQIVYSDSFNQLAQAENANEAFDIFLSDPLNLIGQVTATSLAPMSKSLAAGVTATIFAGPIAGALATGVTSGSTDAAYSFQEFMQKAGMDPNDPRSVAAYMGDKELVAEAKKYARTRGTIIGAFDGLSFGFATKLLAPKAISNIYARQAMNSLVSQPLVQGGLGGGGEYFAQLATKEAGEEIRVGDVAMEIIGEFGFAPVEAAFGQISANRKYNQQAKNEAAEESSRIYENFYNSLAKAAKLGADKNDAQKLLNLVNAKTKFNIDNGQDLIQARANAVQDVNKTVPELVEALNIFSDFTNAGQNPDQFPTKISTPTTTVPNVFLRKINEDGTATIIDTSGNPLVNPNTQETYTFSNETKANKVLAALNLLSQTQYGAEQNIDYMKMQNLDFNNDFIFNLGSAVANPFYDGITITQLRELGVNESVIKNLKDATGNTIQIPISVLKDNVSKKQFDMIMTARSESGILNETESPKTISLAKFKKLFADKNVEFDVESDAFKRLAIQFTGESDINNMSIAQKKLLYSVINRLPASTELIPLPDFSNRSYSIEDYNKALKSIIDTNKPTLKVIKESTGLNTNEAKRLRQDLITAGYVNEKDGRYKFNGLGNKKFDANENLLSEEDIEVNKQIDSLIESFNKILPPEVAIKFEKYLRDQQGNRETRLEGAYDPIFNEIILAIDNAGFRYKEDPKAFVEDLSRVLRHESWHSLRQADVFTESEYNTLVTYVKNKKIKGEDKTYYQSALEEYENVPGYESDADIIEEAIAKVFEDYTLDNKEVTGKPRNILNKVSTFFERTVNALNENGFQTANDIIDRSLSGKIGSRKTGKVRTSLETDRLIGRYEKLQEKMQGLGFDFNSAEDNPVDVRPIEDSPNLKYKFREDLLKNPPKVYKEYIRGIEDGEFSENMSDWVNLMHQNPNKINEYLTKRRSITDKKGLHEMAQASHVISQAILREENNTNKNDKKIFFFVGDISNDSVSIVYDNMPEAIRTAQLGDSMYHNVFGDRNKIRVAELNFSDVLFHPKQINIQNNPTKSNPYKRAGIYGVSTTSLNLKANKPQSVKPALNRTKTKFSLARTEGRITPELAMQLVKFEPSIIRDGQRLFTRVPKQNQSLIKRIQNLNEDEANNYFDLIYLQDINVAKSNFAINLQTDMDQKGSDVIAAILEKDLDYLKNPEITPLAKYFQFTGEQETDQFLNFLIDSIEEITAESLRDFPQEIVVYRGGAIADEYDLVPVTFDRNMAEYFADAAQRLPADLVTEFIIPKDKVIAYMNTIATDMDRSTAMNQYSYFGENEFLVNKNDLIEKGNPIERVGPKFKRQLFSRIKSIKEQAEETRTENEMNFLLGQGIRYTIEMPSMADFKLLQGQLRTRLNKLQNKILSSDEILSLLNDPALQAAELLTFSQQETLSVAGGKLKPVKYTLNEIKNREKLYLNSLIKKSKDYAKGPITQNKKAVILIGLPASGKSHFAEKIAATTQSALVDSDDAKKILPDFGTGLGANAVSNESSLLSQKVLQSHVEIGNNLVIPKVGMTAKYKSVAGLIDNLRNNYDYDVDIILVDADFNSAIQRVLNRFLDTGRYIPSSYLIDVENTPRDTYNNLKADYGNLLEYAFIDNNFDIGEQLVEEDTSGSYQYLGERRRSRVTNDELSFQQEQDQTKETKRLYQKAKSQKQKSIDAGVRPVINIDANPDAVASAVKAQEDILNTPSETNADINFIISDIGEDNKIKFSFKNSGKPLKKSTERLVKRLTIRDDFPDNETVGQQVIKSTTGFFSPSGFRQSILDQYAPLVETDYIAGEISGLGDQMLSASISAQAALYQSDRSGDIFQQAILRGVPVYDKQKGFTYVSETSPQDGQQIVAPYEIFRDAFDNPNMLWAFQAVLRVKRETRFNKEGRKVKITAQDKKDAQQALNDYPQIQTMIDQYQRWNSHVVQFLVDTGVLDQKTGDIWTATSDYIPFYRPLEGMEGFKGPKIFQGLSITPFKRAKGSEEKDIVDPITGIFNNLRAAINVGMKNVAGNRVMRNLEIMGVAEQVKGNVKGPNIIQIKVDGKLTNWKVDDPDLYHSFTMMTGGDFAPMDFFTGALRGTKQVVSDFITRLPDFWIRQILRDSVSAWALSGANYTPIISSLKETVSISVGLATGKLPKEFELLRNSGIITGYDKGVRSIDSTESFIKNLYSKEIKKQRSTVAKVMLAPFDALATLWRVLGQGTAITDAATRVAVMKDTLKRTNSEAEGIFQAMEVLNFTRRGSSGLYQYLAQTTMFLNPRLQGLDVFYRGLTGKYGVGRGLSPSKRLTSVFLRFAGLISLVPYYYLLVRDTEEYKEAPQEIKDNYIIIPGTKNLVGETLAIPKPFEVGLLAFTIPERILAYTLDDVAGKDVADSLARNISHTLSITPPTLAEPLIENYFNYDFFTGRKIVPSYLEGTDDLAFRPTTDTLSRVVGDQLNISPLYVENLIRGYTGTMGTYVMQGFDSMLREGLTGSEKASLRVDQLPVVGAFALPQEGRGIENQFYDLKGMTDDLVKSFRKLEDDIIDKRDTFAIGMAKEYRLEYYDQLRSLQKDLEDTADQLKEFRNLEAAIVNDQTLSGDEKRDQLLKIQEAKNELLKIKQIPEVRKLFLQEIRPRALQR